MMMDDHEIRNDWSRDQILEYGGLYNAAMQAYESYQHLHNPDTRKGTFWYSFDVGASHFSRSIPGLHGFRNQPAALRGLCLVSPNTTR